MSNCTCNKEIISTCEPTFVWADASNFYSKSETDEKIEETVSGKADSSDVYSIDEVDALLSEKLDASAYTPTDLSNYYKKDETSSKTEIEDALLEKLSLSTFNVYSAEVETNKQDVLVAGRAIDIDSANTISLDLPISAGTGANSIVEGASNTASGQYAHAEGFGSRATNTAAHAEGMNNEASAGFTHVGGRNSKASQFAAFAHGSSCQATMTDAFAINTNTKAQNESEFASGRFNVSHKANTTFGNSGNTLFSVGIGTSEATRKNAFEIRQNGDIYITKDGSDILLQDNLGGGSSSGMTSGEVQTMIDNSISGKLDVNVFNVYSGVVASEVQNKAENSDLEALETTFSAFSATIVNEIQEIESSGMTSGAVQDMLTAYTYSKQEIDDKDAEKLSLSAFSAYIGEVSSQLSGKASMSDYEALSGIVSAMSIEIQEIESSGMTSGAVQNMINESISGKMDTTDFNIYSAATETKIDAKPDVWIGTATQWQAISGSTENGTIYLVY